MASSLDAFRFGPRARRDLKGMDPRGRRRVLAKLEQLTEGAENLDVKTLVGKPPHLRLRVGEVRVLYRELFADEVALVTSDNADAVTPRWLVVRVVPRGELERATAAL